VEWLRTRHCYADGHPHTHAAAYYDANAIIHPFAPGYPDPYSKSHTGISGKCGLYGPDTGRRVRAFAGFGEPGSYPFRLGGER
jgi:hypothetical protein